MDRKQILKLVTERASALDWMKDEWQHSKKDGVIFYTDMCSRDQEVWVVFYNCKELDLNEEIDECKLLELAADLIKDPEEFGWVDLDAITWDIQVGDNFHGLPEEMPDFGLHSEEEDNGGVNIVWLKIECSDWAS